ncbi:MAG TPA: glycoside hydrolase family 130 protein [Fimbriimonadaceae bacterium]|nr:glycoside hydrolase family 130 protein [Fimbriimonadaceae bacterium]
MPWQIGPFTRPSEFNPLIRPRPESVFDCPLTGGPVYWEALHTFNPAAAVYRGKVYLLYRAEDASGEMQIGGHTSRLGLATSSDGLRFKREPAPVLFPAKDGQKGREWPGGCEDPRLVEAPDGRFILTYTQYNRQAVRLAVAESRDLRHWVKHGPAFAGTAFGELNCKSGCIVSKVEEGRLLAAKIDGRYWMYWGEGSVRVATSPDLFHWSPVVGKDGEPVSMLSPRQGHFDSDLAEGGAAAVLTHDGIVVFYNGKNATDSRRDPALPAGIYCGGQALFDAGDPARLLSRPEEPFFKPEMPWEKTGQYKDGTTFIEGLVRFRDRWYLYYGCADSFVGVAISGQ